MSHENCNQLGIPVERNIRVYIQSESEKEETQSSILYGHVTRIGSTYRILYDHVAMKGSKGRILSTQ